MQLTHPEFLILDSPTGRTTDRFTAQHRQCLAGSKRRAVVGGFRTELLPIYPASAKLQSWDIFGCVRQVLDVLDPVPDPLPDNLRAELGLVSEDEALRAIHLSENERERLRARERLAFDEAVGCSGHWRPSAW